MPFEDLPLTYTAQVSQQEGLQQIYSNKYRRSNLLLPSVQPPVNQTWTIDDVAIYNSSVVEQSMMEDLVMNPYTLGDGYTYKIS